MDDKSFFCTTCGKEMAAGTMYCPACGSAAASVPAANSPYASPYQRMSNEESKKKIKTAGILLLLGALVLLALGAYYIGSVDSMVDETIKMMEEMGYYLTITPAELKDFIMMLGYLTVAAGALCLISSILCFTRKLRILALIFTIIAALLGFATTIIGGIIGIIVAWYIYKYKDAFNAGPA